MMNFLNLQYFLVAAEELNFTKAAKRLYISQQSLSTHIANLEHELDIALFNRTNPLTLTYAGKTLVQKARLLLDLKDETTKELADIKDFTIGRLSIGVSHTRGRALLPQILPFYREKFPNIELNLLEGNSKELDNALLHGKVDLVIGMLPFMVDNVATVPLCEEEILLVVPDKIITQYFPGHENETKARLERQVDLTLLRECPFLLIKEGNRVRTIADEMFHEAQMTPKVILETENIETVLALAIKGMGITFYPRMFVSNSNSLHPYANQSPAHIYSLTHPKSHGILAIGYHKGHYLSRATQEFIQIAKENI